MLSAWEVSHRAMTAPLAARRYRHQQSRKPDSLGFAIGIPYNNNTEKSFLDDGYEHAEGARLPYQEISPLIRALKSGYLDSMQTVKRYGEIII